MMITIVGIKSRCIVDRLVTIGGKVMRSDPNRDWWDVQFTEHYLRVGLYDVEVINAGTHLSLIIDKENIHSIDIRH